MQTCLKKYYFIFLNFDDGIEDLEIYINSLLVFITTLVNFYFDHFLFYLTLKTRK